MASFPTTAVPTLSWPTGEHLASQLRWTREGSTTVRHPVVRWQTIDVLHWSSKAGDHGMVRATNSRGPEPRAGMLCSCVQNLHSHATGWCGCDETSTPLHVMSARLPWLASSRPTCPSGRSGGLHGLIAARRAAQDLAPSLLSTERGTRAARHGQAHWNMMYPSGRSSCRIKSTRHQRYVAVGVGPPRPGRTPSVS